MRVVEHVSSRAFVAVAMTEPHEGDAVHRASGFEAACSGPPQPQAKKRTRRRKYTRTQEAWEASAARRRAKLSAKYGEQSTRELTAVGDSSECLFNRGIAADYVERVMACARGDAEYIDVHFESAVLLREHILRAQQDKNYALAAAYAEGALTMGFSDLVQ